MPMGELGIDAVLRDIGAATAAPGAGAAIGLSGAIAASLVQMTAALSAERGGGEVTPEALAAIAERAAKIRVEALALAEQDGEVYALVLEALQLPVDEAGRDDRINEASSKAAGPPYALAKLMAEVADLGADVTLGGRRSVRGDATTAVMLAEAACSAACKLVALNLSRVADDERLGESKLLARSAHQARELVSARA